MASRSLLPDFDGRHVVVVGDVMLDRYWYGDSLRISAEAPVPIVHVRGRDDRPGAAANVALNLAALGVRCTLLGVVGDDEAAAVLSERLLAAGVRFEPIVATSWSTIVKLRVSSRNQQMLRMDFEEPVPADAAVQVRERLPALLGGVDALVLEDYDKGTLAEPEALIAAAAGNNVPVLVDPKFKPLDRYRGARLIKPNRVEFERLVGALGNEADWDARARSLMQRVELPALVITRGADSTLLIERDRPMLRVPARVAPVFDETGAGDTVIAVLAAAVAAGVDLPRGTRLATLAASIAVTRPGTVAVSAAELAAALVDEAEHDDRMPTSAASRGVVAVAALDVLVASARARGERVVFTNGCFDVLHAGHVRYLAEAKALGDRLIVATNGDASVTRLKGAGRPINALDHRLEVLAGLTAVDWVTWFDEDTPEALLERLRPEVLVKGGDYGVDEVIGADIVRAWGGEVRVLSLTPGVSSTAVIARARDAAGD